MDQQENKSIFDRCFVVTSVDETIAFYDLNAANECAKSYKGTVHTVERQGVDCEIEPLMTDDLLYSQTVDVTLKALIDGKPCRLILNVETFEGVYLEKLGAKLTTSQLEVDESLQACAEKIMCEAFDVAEIANDFFANYKAQNITRHETAVLDDDGNPYQIREFDGVFEINTVKDVLGISVEQKADFDYFETLNEAMLALANR